MAHRSSGNEPRTLRELIRSRPKSPLGASSTKLSERSAQPRGSFPQRVPAETEGAPRAPARRASAPFTDTELAFAFLDYIGLKREDLQRATRELVAALNAEETKFFAHEGQVIDTRNVVAWAPRLKAAQALLDKFPLQMRNDDTKRRLEVDVTVRRVDGHDVIDVTPGDDGEQNGA